MRKITIHLFRELEDEFGLNEEQITELLERLDIKIPENVKKELE